MNKLLKISLLAACVVPVVSFGGGSTCAPPANLIKLVNAVNPDGAQAQAITNATLSTTSTGVFATVTPANAIDKVAAWPQESANGEFPNLTLTVNYTSGKSDSIAISGSSFSCSGGHQNLVINVCNKFAKPNDGGNSSCYGKRPSGSKWVPSQSYPSSMGVLINGPHY